MIDLLKKWAPGAAVVTAAVTGAGALIISPYGPLRPKPEVCPPQQVCVIVAGLDNDVNIGVGAGDQPFGFDLDDQITRRVVEWVDEAPGEVTVYKMPEEIVIPERGLPQSDAQRTRTLTRAREIGRRYSATLVLIGQVRSGDQSLALQFVNPANSSQTLKPSEYAVPNTGVPDGFVDDFAAALAAAQNRSAPGRNVASAPDAGDPAAPTPISGAAPSGDTPGSVPQANLTAEQRANIQGMIVRLLDNAQEQLAAGMVRAPSIPDEVVGLQPGGEDRWQVALTGGATYRIVGVCDAECSNVDIELLDANGAVVDSDVLPDDFPVVDITPPANGSYVVRTVLKTCTLAPCFVGARVLVRGNAT